MEPIYLKSITIGELYHEESLNRALKQRISEISKSDLPTGYQINTMLQLLHSTIEFSHSQISIEKNFNPGQTPQINPTCKKSENLENLCYFILLFSSKNSDFLVLGR